MSHKHKLKVLLLTLTVAGIMMGCSKDKTETLVTVNGTKITQSALEKRIASLPPNVQASFANDQNRNLLIDQLVNEELLLQEAKAKKLEEKEEFKKQSEALQEQLENTKKQLLMNMLLQENISKDLAVTDADVQGFYNTNKAQFQGQEQRKARHILVKTEEEAKSIRASIASGSNFETLAKEKSIDPTKANGGDLGWFKKGDLVPEFETVVFQMKKGEISDVVKTQFGYHIILLEDTKTSAPQSFDQVKGQIQQYLYNQKRSTAVASYLKTLKDKAKITKKEAPKTPEAPKGK